MIYVVVAALFTILLLYVRLVRSERAGAEAERQAALDKLELAEREFRKAQKAARDQDLIDARTKPAADFLRDSLRARDPGVPGAPVARPPDSGDGN
jgi:hypothetical protein